LTSESVHWA